MKVPTKVEGAKHIARLQRRADALQARMFASPEQADFIDESAELKSLQWVIAKLSAAPVDLGERLPDAVAIVQKHRREIEMSPGVGLERQNYGIAVCDDIINDLGRAAPAQPVDGLLVRALKVIADPTDAYPNLPQEIRDTCKEAAAALERQTGEGK